MKQKYVDGSYFLINLNNSRFQLGRILKKPLMVIYDKQFENIPNFNKKIALNSKTLFIVPIASRSIENNIFKIIGHDNITKEELELLPPQFHQKLTNLNRCTLVYFDGREVSATPQECIGLEAIGSWDVEHVIERIEDHYKGKPNINYELTKVKIPEASL